MMVPVAACLLCLIYKRHILAPNSHSFSVCPNKFANIPFQKLVQSCERSGTWQEWTRGPQGVDFCPDSEHPHCHRCRMQKRKFAAGTLGSPLTCVKWIDFNPATCFSAPTYSWFVHGRAEGSQESIDLAVWQRRLIAWKKQAESITEVHPSPWSSSISMEHTRFFYDLPNIFASDFWHRTVQIPTKELKRCVGSADFEWFRFVCLRLFYLAR